MRSIGRTGLACVAAILALGAAPSEDPVFTERPDANDLNAARPQGSPDEGGSVILECDFSARGAPTDCRAVEETPKGSGFGQAALGPARKFRLAPAKRDGKPVEAKNVRIPITFPPRFDKEGDWLKRPGSRDLLAVYPLRAQGRGGRAELACTVSAQGTLYDCEVKSEQPAGAGFGKAALALTPQFLMRPPTRDGKPLAGFKVGIPISWPAQAAILGAPEMTTKVFSDVPWTAAPSYQQVAAAFPAKARANRRSGRATLNCRIAADGGLERCEALAEEPRGLGFGEAARSLAGAFRAPTTFEGQSVAGFRTQVLISFPEAMIDSTDALIGKPQWAALPDARAFNAAFPKTPSTSGATSARVIMLCRVGADGGLGDCAVESETPAGEGYGAACLKLAPLFKVRLWTSEGLPAIGGRVRAPVRYDLPKPPPQAAAEAPGAR